jgi:hypothetical protein
MRVFRSLDGGFDLAVKAWLLPATLSLRADGMSNSTKTLSSSHLATIGVPT